MIQKITSKLKGLRSILKGIFMVVFMTLVALGIQQVLAWTGSPASGPPNDNVQAPCFSDGTNCPAFSASMAPNAAGKYPAGYVFTHPGYPTFGNPVCPVSACISNSVHVIAPLVDTSGTTMFSKMVGAVALCQCN